MANSREQSQFGRRRSNTGQSSFNRAIPPPSAPVPLGLGDSKVLNAWVHDVKDSPAVIFNQSWWPGIAEGDLLKVLSSNADNPESAFLFVVPKDEGCPKPQLQISVPRPIADIFSLRNNGEVTLTKVDKAICCAEYVEFMFQDQYLGRNDMWRVGRYLSGQCIYEDQEISFCGGIAAKIMNIYIGGEKVSSAWMAASTKAIYRSFSAKVTIFIQVCRELWEFAGDGERYNEKIVHSFLPTLFIKWREAGTNHIVTIVLISRVYYDDSEIDYAAGPLRRDERGEWYKDFFKVITDLSVLYDQKETLVSLKNSFWDFQRDILLTHHYHQATQDSAIGAPAQVRLVGRLSYAQDGPVLEALNLGLNSTETHYIDRSLNLTGTSTILISPGTGYFRVSKQLLRLTTTRILDQGFGLDLILLTKPPLHQSPIFSFEGTEPVGKFDKEDHDGKDGNFDPLVMDPLWGGDDDSKTDARVKKTFWWEAFWIATTFWDRQMDLPFRQDRFVARAKMHEIQMLGLLEHDVLSSIEVPYLSNKTEPPAPLDIAANTATTKSEADIFDLDTFSLTSNYNATNMALDLAGNGGPGLRAYPDKRASHRNSAMIRISTIEESPKRIHLELPSEGLPTSGIGPASVSTSVRSPSPTSIRSTRSEKSTASLRTTSWSGNLSKGTLASKLAPSWLFNPFRSGPSEPQTTQVSASASPIAGSHPKEKQKESMENPSTIGVSHSPKVPSSPIRMPPPSKATVASSTQQVQPMAIRNRITDRNLNRAFEEETIVSYRAPHVRRSPISTPPDDILAGKRRSAASTLAQSYTSMSPGTIMNPTRPQVSISQSQASLARRWQHVYPHSSYKYDFNWKSIVTPGCLPLTVEYMPSAAVLDSSFDVFSYEFVVDPSEMRSFLAKPPIPQGTAEDLRRAWALTVMRSMAAVRLAQGFQFILKPPSNDQVEVDKSNLKRAKSLIGEEDLSPKPTGAAEVLNSTTDPVYLSMTNEIHRIVYTGETIQVRRYVRRMSPTRPFAYRCLIWPKLGGGYTELSAEFRSDGLENYGWNRLDMLVAGYEHHFNESLRYWRTRFIVIPTSETPHISIGPSGEILNSEEARILGIEKLAEYFTKLRLPDDASHSPVRLLHTTLDPAASVLDEDLMENLDQIHAAGPLRKKMKSDREIADMPLSTIAKAMREEGGVPIKFYQWHHCQYPNSFTGYDFVSWLVREFRDVSSRTQAAEWGIKFQAQGLFEHCRGRHTFLDGHYYYRLIGEYSVHMTPKYWFRRNTDDGIRPAYSHSNSPKQIAKPVVGRKNKRRLILSQTMAIDVDPLKRSDQAESAVLHHDIIHNPGTVFHFELQWIGTTARCIEDQLRLWNRTIERYGLKLVEAYVTQISDIRDRNTFQSCFPMTLALSPPIVPDLEQRIPDGKQSKHYFEYALLKAFDFILDVEAADLYPEQIDVVYSYRRSPYKYSQFVHRSGVAFIQVLGGSQGFLFLINRLMVPGKIGSAKSFRPATIARDIRLQMARFCSDKERLQQFYDKLLAELPPAPLVAEEPPSLTLPPPLVL